MDEFSLERFADRHPGTVHLLRQFRFSHLPESLQRTSRPIAEVAYRLAYELPDGPELSAGLRKLLEGKDCLVRARVDQLAGE